MNVLVVVIGTIAYLLMGAVFAGIFYDMWHYEDLFILILLWPILAISIPFFRLIDFGISIGRKVSDAVCEIKKLGGRRNEQINDQN